jgi:hypothetical protein
VLPTAVLWLSLAGSLLLPSYALFYEKDSVFIFAYAFTWIPCIRNLIIHRRHAAAHLDCPSCGGAVPAALEILLFVRRAAESHCRKALGPTARFTSSA